MMGRRSHPKKILVVALALLLPLFPLSAQAEIVRLADLEAHALHHAPALSAGGARVAQANARLDRAQDAYYPSFSLDATGSLAPGGRIVEIRDIHNDLYYISGSRAFGEPGAFTPQPRYGLLLGIRDNLYDFGRRRDAVDAASADRRASQADAQASERKIRREVRGAYLRWATAHALWLLARDRAGAAEQRERRVLAFITEGVRPKADGTASATQRAQADIDAERAAADLEATRIDLIYVSGRVLGPNAAPEPTLLAGDANTVTRADPTDPTAEALDAQRAAAEANARAFGHAREPLLAATANAGVEGRADFEGRANRVFPVYALGLSLSIPLWDGGIASAQGDEARAKAAELEALSAVRREATRHGRARTEAAKASATRRIALAQRWIALSEARVSELEASEELNADALAALTAAQAERDRARLELVLAQSDRAQANLGLLEP
jgi:outer membrane protein TolC